MDGPAGRETASRFPRSPESLKQRVLRAGGWVVAGYGTSQALRLASSLVMTRLLVPEMFGVMAIAGTVIIVLNMVSDVGLRQSIVQSRRGDDPLFLDTAWTLQIARGVMLWMVALLLSLGLHVASQERVFPPRSVYDSPVLPWVIAASSFALIVNGFQSTRMATYLRDLDPKRLVQIELASQVAGLLVMFVSGVLTRSIWALVAGGLINSMVTTALSHAWMEGHGNRLRWEPRALGELMHFGKWIFLSSALYVLAVNGDRLLLGGLVDEQILGFYAIALLIVGAVEGGVNRVFQTVSLPALSEVARDRPGRLTQLYYRLRIPGDLLLLFTAGFLFVAGQRVIDLLYDPRYAMAGGFLEILALSMFAVRYGVSNQIYVAMGLPKYQTVLHAVRFVSLYALVPFLYFIGGIRTAIWGIALHSWVMLPWIYYYNSKFGLNDLRRELLVLMALPAGAAFGAVWNLQHG